MRRIAILGNAGGGKSTLARGIRDELGLPLHSIDQMQWRPGWERAPKMEFVAAHEQAILGERWIIDGWGDFEAIEKRLCLADTIVLIDYPVRQHYWWAMKRQIKCLFRAREDGPPGCPMIPMTWPMLKMIGEIDRHLMPRIRALAEAHAAHSKLYHIRSSKDRAGFVSALKTSSRH